MKTTLKFALDNATPNIAARWKTRRAAHQTGVDVTRRPEIDVNWVTDVFNSERNMDRNLTAQVTGTPDQVTAFKVVLTNSLNRHALDFTD